MSGRPFVSQVSRAADLQVGVDRRLAASEIFGLEWRHVRGDFVEVEQWLYQIRSTLRKRVGSKRGTEKMTGLLQPDDKGVAFPVLPWGVRSTKDASSTGTFSHRAHALEDYTTAG